MTDDAQRVVHELWKRAIHRIKVAESLLLSGDTDESASMAFYAAFFSVSALITSEGLSYKKHSALRSALHHRYISTGEIDPEIGRCYDFLESLRRVGDYGQLEHVSSINASKAVERAHTVLNLVSAYLDAKGIPYK